MHGVLQNYLTLYTGVGKDAKHRVASTLAGGRNIANGVTDDCVYPGGGGNSSTLSHGSRAVVVVEVGNRISCDISTGAAQGYIDADDLLTEDADG